MATWSTQSALRECQMAPNGELTVVERLATLLETGQFADVSIKVGKGECAQTFRAHRLLLATASKPLNKLVTATPQNGTGEPTLIVNDIDPESFQHVLKYIYTDDVKVGSVAEALALLKISKEWSLETLGMKTMKFCTQFLQEFEPYSEEMKNDICDLMYYTEAEEEDEAINKKCWEVLLKYVNEIVPCQSFLNFTEKTLRKLLNHKKFHYKKQVILFESIRDWGMNQVLQRNLNVDQLKPLVSDLLKHVDFKDIKEGEFLQTVLPSECLGKADLIAFFLARGLDIPRDLAQNNKMNQISMNGHTDEEFEKAIRFKRGQRIYDEEIYKEHELRFRVDKNLKLYGVVFGFLFSNTDMGITVHCQGPWETRQWSDIIQTYCRVSFEKMKTADVRLMFSEPVLIEANHSYKILVRVSRMSAGTSEVELWGGGEGQPNVKTKDAAFYFLKSAVDPKKEVSEKDIDSSPSMITELIYQQEDYEGVGIKESLKESFSPIPPPSTKKEVNESKDTEKKLTRPAIVNVQDEENPTGTSNYKRNRPESPKITTPIAEKKPTSYSWQNKANQNESPSSNYLKPKTQTSIPDYLAVKDKKKSLEPSKLPWMIPTRSKTDNLSAIPSTTTREPSVSRTTRESSITRTRDYNPVSRTSSATKFGISSYSTNKYAPNLSCTPAYSRLSSTGLSTSSRASHVTPAAAYGKDTSLASSSSSSRLSQSVTSFLNRDSKYRQPTPTRFGQTGSTGTSSTTSSDQKFSTNKYGPTSTTTSKEVRASPARHTDSTSMESSSKKESTTTPRYGDTLSSSSSSCYWLKKPSTTDSSSRYGQTSSTSNDTSSNSRFGQSSTTNRFGTGISSIASRFGATATTRPSRTISSGTTGIESSKPSTSSLSNDISKTSRYTSQLVSPISSRTSRFGPSRFGSSLASSYTSPSLYSSSYRR